MNSKNTRSQLFLTAVAIAVLWQVPFGNLVLYPLTLLATFTHEMGHGLTALALGQHFDQFMLNADGSGLASWRGAPGSRLVTALVAAGGLVGPSVVGSVLLILSRYRRHARLLLLGMTLFMVASAAIWVRNGFGLAFVLAWAGVFAIAFRTGSDRIAAATIHVVALTLCMAVFNDWHYMFSDSAFVNGVLHHSDSAAIAQALVLPYWVWGAAVAAFSVGVMAIGIRIALHTDPEEPKPVPPLGTSEWRHSV